MKDRKVKRGEIYCYDFGENSGSVQTGRRPVLVVQADNFNEHSPTTVIAAISSAHKCKYLPSHIFLGEEFGLTQPSVVLLEQIRTVNQNELGAYIGIIDDGDMLNAISNGLKKTLGMWRYQTARTETRCLCGRCLQEYMDTRAYIISRLDPFQKQKDSCDRCGKPGFDYALKERTKRF